MARLSALAALLAGVAAIVVVLLSLGGGGDGGGGSTSGTTHAASPGPARLSLPNVAAVRNASPQPGWEPYSGAVPILRYHAVGVAPSGETYTELFVTPADFREQMDWLEAHGYEAVGLETVEDAWFGNGRLPEKPIVLSFDGIAGRLLDLVVPDLRRRGWPADLVLDTEARPLRAGAAARLLALGWDLEPSGRDPAAARRFLRARLAAPARNFAFPQGDSAGSETAALEAAGYTGATATGGGFASAAHPFDLPRITIFNASRIDGFAEALRSHGEGVGA